MDTTGKYEMHLIVPTKLVGTIVELLDGEGIVVTLKALAAPDGKKAKGFKYAGGKKNKGISGPDAVLAILGAAKGKPLTVNEISKTMAKDHGFSVNSARPVLSVLVKDKKVKRDGEKYLLISS